jgi:hypothetical protein
MSRNAFMPAFARALASRGFRTRHFKDPWLFLLAGKIDGPIIVVPVYNEARSLRMPRFIEAVAGKRYGATAVLHPTHIAALVSDKAATNRALSEAGVPMPALVEGRAGTHVFSNARDQSGARVNVVEAGEATDPSRYNAELIDTVHELGSSKYYVCLRVACVGQIPCSITVRARPVEDNNPSVHLGNTPRNPELLNWLYESLVRDRRGEIEELCACVERRLGLGFFGHDIMPERGTGKLYLAETGFKFDDLGYRGHMHSIANSLTFADEFSNAAIERAADALISEARRTGALPGGHADRAETSQP